MVLDTELQELDERLPALIATEAPDMIVQVLATIATPIRQDVDAGHRAYAQDSLEGLRI